MNNDVFIKCYLEILEESKKLALEERGEDYNNEGIKIMDYFPFNDVSYLQMIWLKTLRLRSLKNAPKGKKLEDIRDLINYAAFYGAWLKGNK